MENWRRFALYLSKRGVSQEAISLAEEQLSGILQTALAPRFELGKDGSFDDEDIMRVISLLTGRPVKELYKQSYSELAGITSPTKSMSSLALVKKKMGCGVSSNFRTCLDSHDEGLSAILIYTVGLKKGLIKPMRILNPLTLSNIFDDVAEDMVSVMKSAGGGLDLLGIGLGLKDKLWPAFGRKMGNEVWRGIESLLRYYVAFLLLNNPNGRDLAAVGLDLCSQAYPVGVLENRPFAWLVMIS